jgi:hypothetical protein
MSHRTERDLEQQIIVDVTRCNACKHFNRYEASDMTFWKQQFVCGYDVFVNDYDLTSHYSKQVQNGIICNTF